MKNENVPWLQGRYMNSVFNRVSAFFAPPHVEPFVPPSPPLANTTFDAELKKYLDYELNTYMSGRHMCNTCDACWRNHKKIAVRLLKLHPATYKSFD
jgi:hypothetical protein